MVGTQIEYRILPAGFTSCFTVGVAFLLDEDDGCSRPEST